MLVKINHLKKIELQVDPEIPEKIKKLNAKATELGYSLDLSTPTSKFLAKEITKLDEQLTKELESQTQLNH
ncbi:MAG: hypothetical protein K2X94_00870 [Amoebophilaceae bacterium]|nr:hypothetical protein [Amoebophilaceae bacterium]